MERRVLIAVFLSFLVLYAYQAYFAPVVPPAQEVAGQSATQNNDTNSATVQTPTPAESSVSLPAVVAGEPVEREITVDTKTVQVVFSNRGGRVLHWRLKSYTDEAGAPVDMVPTGVPPEQPRPFSLSTQDAGINTRLNTGLYRVQGDAAGRVDGTAAPVQLTFEFQDVDGLRVRKDFAFEPEGYVVRFSASAQLNDRTLNPAIEWGPGLGDIGARSGGGSFFTGNYVQPPEAIFHKDNSTERVAAGSLAESGRPVGEFAFVGIDDHYFLAAALPQGQTQAVFSSMPLGDAGTDSRQLVTMALQFSQSPKDARFFVGPKQLDTLRAVDQNLVRAINFGMFAWLVFPLLSTLKWFYGFVGNYGWSIIILTVLINLVIFPLRHKSLVSMRKMQALQPQLKAIQDRYAGLKVTDPARQKMNTEVMNLYKERGVNPASGCVPALLPLPVLFAFYSLLSQSIELRDAPFGLWIQDLSVHDPFYVTPLLMGASMFWQARISPTTADPAQQKMMMFMPIVFTAMFLRLPSGLALYYFTNTLWAIGQQYLTNKWIGPAPALGVKRAPDRQLKNAGSGRTTDADRKN